MKVSDLAAASFGFVAGMTCALLLVAAFGVRFE